MINKDILVKYDNLILATIYRMNIKNKDAVDNIHADCWIKLLESQNQFDPEKSQLATWIVSIVRNTCMNHMRDLKRSEDVMDNTRVSLDHKVYESTENEEAFTDVSDRRKSDILEEFMYLIADFPKDWQQMLKLRLVLGHSYDEIAAEMKRSPDSVKGVLKRATKKLKGRIKTEGSPRENYGDDLTLQDMYNTLPKEFKFPFKFRVVEGKTWKQVQKLIDLPVDELERRVNIARDMIFQKYNVEV